MGAGAGLVAAGQARDDAGRIAALAETLNSPVREIEKKIETSLGQVKKLEKQLKALLQRGGLESLLAFYHMHPCHDRKELAHLTNR